MHAAAAAGLASRCAASKVPPRSPAGSSSCPSSPLRTSGRCTPTPLCGIPPLTLPRAAVALAALSLASPAAGVSVDAPTSTAAEVAPPQQQQQEQEQQTPPPPLVDPIEAENEALAEFVSWLIANGVTGLSEPDARVGIYAEPIETSNDNSSSSSSASSSNASSLASAAATTTAAAASATTAAPASHQGLNRGVLALRDFEEGEELFRVPLRLAITDHVTKGGRSGLGRGGTSTSTATSSTTTCSTSSSSYDEDDAIEAGRHRAEPSAWGARLASRLLREKARGRASPWAPWLSVLPTTTTTSKTSAAAPSVVTKPGSLRSAWAGALPREVAALLPCPAAAAALLRASGAADAEFSRLPRSALETARKAAAAAAGASSSSSAGNAEDDSAALACYRWARAVVQSRTFGSTAKEDGSGSINVDAAAAAATTTTTSTPSAPSAVGLVRMLVPLADFVNHAGDEAEVLLSGRRAPTANAEWKVAADDENDSWSLVVSSTRPLVAGEEVSFSYGDRRNADFLVSYGFVPARNPHDAVCLFESVEEAVEWASRWLGIEGSSSLVAAAVAAADEETSPTLAASATSRDPEIAAEARRLWLWAGAGVDERLAAAFAVVAAAAAEDDSETTAASLVAARAAELLSRSGAPPLADALGELERAGEHEHEEQQYYRALKRRYAAKEPAVRRAAAAVAVSSADAVATTASSASVAPATPPPIVAPAAPLPPPPPRGGSRSAWRGVRLMALRAGVYSTMILWDALEAADKASGGGGATAKKNDAVAAVEGA